MDKPLRVGIIGANAERGWARESHIPAVQKLAGLELAAVANKGKAAADAAANAFGVGKAYGDARELIDDPDIDLVTVAVTLPAHHELILAALAAKKHIYCEYPLGRDVTESRELATAAKQAAVHTAIGLQTRMNPAVQKARDLIAAGAIGRPLSARVYSSTMGFGAKTMPAEAYTEKLENGVTVVTIQGAHTLDLVTALLGEFDDVVALATTQYLPHWIRIGDGELQARLTTFDHLLVQSRLANGAALSVEVAGGRPPETPFKLECGRRPNGVLALEGGAPRWFSVWPVAPVDVNGQLQTLDEGEIAQDMADAAANVAGMYATLRDDIATNATTVLDFDHAVQVAQLIEDATTSSQTGRRKISGNWPGQA